MSSTNIKCIICGNIKQGSDEHVIPKSLGNEVLRINNVCKNCNDGLGKYVDEHLVNNFLSQLIRLTLNLRGQSKKVPNPFAKGKDSQGRQIHVSDEFKPSLPLRLEQDGNIIRTVGGTQEQSIKALESKLKRMGKTESEIQEIISSAIIKIDNYQPELHYNCEFDINKLSLGILKIAYEYMYLTFGEQFYEDETAQKIRKVLYQATLGDFSEIYETQQYIPQSIKDIYLKYAYKYKNAHILYLIKDTANQLVLNISLFKNDALTFAILVSKDASKYNLEPSKKNVLTIIDIDTQQKINL